MYHRVHENFFGMLLAIAPLVLIDIEAIHPPYFLALIIMSNLIISTT